MLKKHNERYFAAGLAGAIFALYAASMFTYFTSTSVTESVVQSTAPSGGVEIAAVADKRAHAASTKQLASIMEKTQSYGIFSPIGKDDMFVPGTDCKITEQNLDHSYNFQNLPDGCVGLLVKD